ncbi:CDC27 family protein [uncultured Cyclobacterium sp.]|uniref:tetratricopeptide repeat protein n=1 Tax=uncultured Cyclobacterium sp. TaxID=453820 RepID=UPI0030EBDFDD
MDKYPNYISQAQQEEFERILLDQMDSKEIEAFNNKINGDPVLKKQFDEFKDLFLAIEEEGLRNLMDIFHDNPKGESDAKKHKFYWYQIAASIVLLLSFGIWFFNKQSPNEKLFQSYFTVDPGLPTVMGTNDNYAFYEAMVDYKQGNYDLAINKWEKLLPTDQNSDTLNYFLGSAYLAKGNSNKAIDFFKNTLNADGSVFSKDAHYYLALGLLKNNNTEEAIKHLKMVADEKSVELLKKIQK